MDSGGFIFYFAEKVGGIIISGFTGSIAGRD
jgi:hypothetical protein